MRALVFAEAIFRKLSRSASTRLSRSLDCLPGSEKYARKRFSYYVHCTISLCLATLIFTLSVFLICTLDPGWKGIDRPWLGTDPTSLRSRPGRALQSTSLQFDEWKKSTALHGLGVTFRKGSRSMNELVVAHLDETTTPEELRLFLRTLHRSGVTAKADVALLFPTSPLPKDMADVIIGEEKSWWQLMLELQLTAPPHTSQDAKEDIQDAVNPEGRTLLEAPSTPVHVEFPDSNSSISEFHATAFWKAREEGKPRGDAFWGSSSVRNDEMTTAVDWGDWGSVVGLEMQDLDSDEALKGFIEEPPARLRRWISYQMLLGMVKSKFRNVLLTAVGEVLIIGDVLAATRKKTFDLGLSLFQEDQTWSELHHSRSGILNEIVLEGESTGSHDDDLRKGESEQLQDGGNLEGLVLKASGEESESGDHRRRISVERPELQFIAEVYGKEKWKSMEEEDKEKAVIGTGLIMGHMKPIRSLLGTMGTEIVAVAALVRKSRQSFHDRPLLNMLVHKSSILSKRVTEKLHVMKNSDSSVHSLPASKQQSIFFKDAGPRFAALQGLKDDLVDQETLSTIIKTVSDDICSSQADSKFYSDCLNPKTPSVLFRGRQVA